MDYAITMADLGRHIRETRKKLGKSQSWVAERAGCRRQTITDLENGKNTSLATLFAVLRAMGKRVAVVDARPALEELQMIYQDEGDEP
ncbi:MAG: helix-turn-helix domain-containing protein [Proteobacteria bacterium]|nr:helix-turn-helix domain-containing protein [Pseudomonadota bacterium]MCL2307841.1 helix-turn-helix domain-containing protein [Pseudomonadota bacterium]